MSMNVSASHATSPYATLANTGRAARANPAQDLAPEEAAQVARLQQIDRKVRTHEQAHMAAGAGLAGGASYQYQRGPDGRDYAVAGEVSISLSSGRTPDETIARARQVQAAALAPADPSSQDRAVAARAARMEQQAQMDKLAVTGNGAAINPLAQRGVAAYQSIAGQETNASVAASIDIRA